MNTKEKVRLMTSQEQESYIILTLMSWLEGSKPDTATFSFCAFRLRLFLGVIFILPDDRDDLGNYFYHQAFNWHEN